MGVDLILSSGFLAFGRHIGFLEGVADARVPVGAVVGTSSGALVGALWAAGLDPEDILGLLTAQRPLAWLRPNAVVWRGAFRLDGMIDALRAHLPPTFDALPTPLGVGVVDAAGHHHLLTAGPLPEAVAASCAVPYLMAPVDVPGVGPLRDGAIADRIALAAWRAWRPGRRGVVHLVDRTHGAATDVDGLDLPVVRTPASGARLWDLGDVRAHADEARRRAGQTLGATRP